MNTHTPTNYIDTKGRRVIYSALSKKTNGETDLRDEDSPKSFLNQSVFLFCSKVMTP